MRKILAATLLATASLGASAEGYQVNTFSARQEGMGHTGVAMKLGAESLIFNPAATSFMTETFQISGSVSAIKADASCTHDGVRYNSDNKISTPLNVSAAFRIYDNLYAGVTFYTPYGSSINWGKNWPGAVMNQSVDLKVFTVQPTVSWRITPKFSIGAGLMISWGSVNLNKGLVDAAAFDRTVALQNGAADLQYRAAVLQAMVSGQNPADVPQPAVINNRYGNVSPASVNLNGSAEPVVGFNVGAMYEINDQWTVGASFRSKMNMKVKSGDASVEYADELSRAILGQQLDALNYTNFAAAMPCPYILTAGVSYKPIEKLTLAFDAQLNGWSAYKQLDIEFAELEAFNQHLVKKYHDAMTLHLGGEYNLTDRFDLRAGLMVDFSPCNKEHYNPETPGATKFEPSVGFSFRPVKGLSIDVAFMYVHGMKVKNASGSYSNFLAPSYNAGLAQYTAGVAQYNSTIQMINGSLNTPIPAIVPVATEPMQAEGRFAADYRVHAIIPAIGLSYTF